MGKFLMKTNEKGSRFVLKAGNGEIIGKSEGYKAKASAKKGIASVGKNAPEAQIIVDTPEG